MAQTGHLPNAKSVVTSVTSRLVTKSRARFWKRLRNVAFAFSWRDPPCRFRTKQLLGFVVGLPAGLSFWRSWGKRLLLVCSRLHPEILAICGVGL